jgi:hypothetical protein
MRKNILYFAFIFSALFYFTACEKTDEASFDLNIAGLEDLGSSYAYEGWLIVEGNAVSTGTFTVDADGNLSESAFAVSSEDLELATTFVLTIEPSPDNDTAPSEVHVLAGDFSGNAANLSISHGAALNNGFANSAGTYLLATPSNGADNDEKSGVWFLDPSSGTMMPGLTLPQLPSGWTYEGWAVIDGIPVSTGTFSAVDMIDDAAPYSGNEGTPSFPGEDFIMNAPAGLSFATDLSGGMVVISVEPVPDNSSAPFAIKPLVGMIDVNAADHTIYSMDQNLVFPTGTATR